MTIEKGDGLPEFQQAATNGLTVNSQQLRGHYTILYFYPRDNTPGCTQESQDFAALHQEFCQLNTEIFGISRDNVASHEKFKAKLALPFELIADTDETLCQLFGVMKDKNMYGKKVRGIERSTFLIDPDGVVQGVWRKVSVKEHAAELLNTLKGLGTAKA